MYVLIAEYLFDKNTFVAVLLSYLVNFLAPLTLVAVHNFSCCSELFVGMKVERKPQSGMEEVPRHLPSGTEVRRGYHVDPKDQPRARKPCTQPRDSCVPRFVERGVH